MDDHKEREHTKLYVIIGALARQPTRYEELIALARRAPTDPSPLLRESLDALEEEFKRRFGRRRSKSAPVSPLDDILAELKQGKSAGAREAAQMLEAILARPPTRTMRAVDDKAEPAGRTTRRRGAVEPER